MKNLIEGCITAIVWWCWGFGVGFGNVGTNMNKGFVGSNYFLAINEWNDQQYALWFFTFVFASSACTIPSGSISERVDIRIYFFFVVLMAGIIYPFPVAWGWGGGWLSQMGFIDFAGSCLIHLSGGTAGLIGAIIAGPRLGRFKPIRE